MDQYVTPSIHYQTQNLSAIKCYRLLKDLGVKNNKFMLTIYDTSLIHVNPFSKNLTPEQQHRIHAEIIRNPWYFFREIVRVNVAGGTSRFEFHRGNIAILWLLVNNINVYLELPRQFFKTGSIAAYLGWLYGFKTRNSKMSLLSKDPESVKDNLLRVRQVLDNLPPYLQMLDTKSDHINKESMSSGSSGNVIQTRSSPGTEDQAMLKGRGSSEPVQFDDELPFIKFIKTIVLNSAPSWYKSATFARQNNMPYCRIFASTPGILGTPEGDFVFYDFLPQCVRFDEKLFYDQKDIETLKTFIHNESKNEFVYIKFTYKQLGAGEDYFEQQCRNLMNDRDAIEREVLLRWSARSLDSPFTKEQLDRVAKSIRTPIGSIIIRNRYVLKFYKKPNFAERYVISVDCSGMLDTDYSSLTVVDPHTFEPVATLRSNARDSYSNTSTFGKCIADIALNIFKNALIVIERNNMGIAIIDNILDQHPELTDRMYSSELEPATEGKNNDYVVGETNSDANVLRYDNKVIVYGFQTNQARRGMMFSEILGIIINELYDCVNDNDIFTESNGIVRKKGRLDHRNGKHDDMLFSWLIGLWVLCYSKILSSKYNYPFNYVRPMSVLDQEEKQLTESDFDNKTRIEQVGEMVVKNFQKNNAFNDSNNNRLHQIFNPNTPEEQTFDTNRASIADIGDMIFGDNSSLFEGDSNFTTDEPVIDYDNEIEDNFHKAQQMDKSDREAFLREQNDILDSNITKAKNKRYLNLEKARNVKEKNKLAQIIRENPNFLLDQAERSKEETDIVVNKLVDGFFSNF